MAARQFHQLLLRCVASVYLLCFSLNLQAEPVTVADASLSAAFYSDSSCLLTIDDIVQAGKTVIDANVGEGGSRMLIHCDTESGRRLTLLAKGDALNVSHRAPLLTREQITEGEPGMIAWLTRSGVNYTDDNAPRRYVIAGSVMLRKTAPVEVAGTGLNSQHLAFARITGLLEPILKPQIQPVLETSDALTPNQSDAENSKADTSTESESSTTPAATGDNNKTADTNSDADGSS